MDDRSRFRDKAGQWWTNVNPRVSASVETLTSDAVRDVAFVLGVNESKVVKGILEQWRIENKDELEALQGYADGDMALPKPQDMTFNFLLPGLIEPIEVQE